MRNEPKRGAPALDGSAVARRRPLALGVLLGIVGATLCLWPTTFRIEESVGLGLLFAARGPLPAPTDVVIVGVSRDTARVLGQTTELDTWPRDLHAQLLEQLTAQGASVVAFDLLFQEQRAGPGDALFAAAIERAGNVVLLEWTGSDVLPLGGASQGWVERRTLPLPELKEAALGSAPFVLPAVPVSVGQSWTFGRASDDMPSLPVLALQAHLLPYYEGFVRLVESAYPGATTEWPQNLAALREQRNLERTITTIRRSFQNYGALRPAAQRELDRGGRSEQESAALAVLLDLYAGRSSRFLNFYGAARSVATHPYDRALEGGVAVDGKIVLVGLSEPRQPEQQDDFISVFSDSTGVNLSGVELGATAVANLLEQRTLNLLPLPLHAALVLVLGIALGFVVGRATMLRASGIALLAAALYFGVAYWQFASAYLWLPLFVPLAVQLPASFGAAVWWNYRELAEQRERVRTALGYYVPRSLAERLTEQTLTPGADRQLLHGTCLVTDAEHYTSIAERLTPTNLAALVNDYYEAIFRVVQAHGGEISDTAGDSMVAVWASSRPDAGTRLGAARAALAILDAVAEFNRSHPESPLPTRVGLESGELLLGNIGAEQRYEYRAVGDIVNTASRIQGLNQLLGTRVLISAATLSEVALPARDVGTFLLRGKRLPVRVLEPITRDGCRLDGEGLAAFAAALVAFRNGDWHGAHTGFAALADRFEGDGPSLYYSALSSAMRESPPTTWTGAVQITTK